MKKVLIIKPGYSETLDPDNLGTVSLGDVLRSTVILHLFPPNEYEVTWVVDKQAVALLKDNSHIKRIVVINEFTPQLLLSERYDILINLEKDLGICAMCDHIQAWQRYGFRLDNGNVGAYSYSEEALTFTQDSEAKKNKDKSWSEVLYEMLGYVYTDEQYIIGYKPKQKLRMDIGLNHLIGAKFPTKAWPKENWEELDKRNANVFVCWQEGNNNLETYMDWIGSCGTIVTNDSLGLHIALAFNKRVVALFGPTLASEVHSCSNLIKLVSHTGNVADITVNQVDKAIEEINER